MYCLKSALLSFITIFQTKEYVHKDRTISKITLLMFNHVLRFELPFGLKLSRTLDPNLDKIIKTMIATITYIPY